MTTYDYRLIEHPKEADLKALGAAGWRMAGYGTDARDGALAWVIMECVGESAVMLTPPIEIEAPRSNKRRAG